MIERNLEIIKTADWVLDPNPEGDVKGGEIVGEGTPEKVRQGEGQFHRPVFPLGGTLIT